MGISYFIWRVDAFRRPMYHILCIDVVDDSNDLGEEREEDREKDREEDRD